jgi:fructose-1,6-bisphosphatase
LSSLTENAVAFIMETAKTISVSMDKSSGILDVIEEQLDDDRY